MLDRNAEGSIEASINIHQVRRKASFRQAVRRNRVRTVLTALQSGFMRNSLIPKYGGSWELVVEFWTS